MALARIQRRNPPNDPQPSLATVFEATKGRTEGLFLKTGSGEQHRARILTWRRLCGRQSGRQRDPQRQILLAPHRTVLPDQATRWAATAAEHRRWATPIALRAPITGADVYRYRTYLPTYFA